VCVCVCVCGCGNKKKFFQISFLPASCRTLFCDGGYSDAGKKKQLVEVLSTCTFAAEIFFPVVKSDMESPSEFAATETTASRIGSGLFARLPTTILCHICTFWAFPKLPSTIIVDPTQQWLTVLVPWIRSKIPVMETVDVREQKKEVKGNIESMDHSDTSSSGSVGSSMIGNRMPSMLLDVADVMSTDPELRIIVAKMERASRQQARYMTSISEYMAQHESRKKIAAFLSTVPDTRQLQFMSHLYNHRMHPKAFQKRLMLRAVTLGMTYELLIDHLERETVPKIMLEAVLASQDLALIDRVLERLKKKTKQVVQLGMRKQFASEWLTRMLSFGYKGFTRMCDVLGDMYKTRYKGHVAWRTAIEWKIDGSGRLIPAIDATDPLEDVDDNDTDHPIKIGDTSTIIGDTSTITGDTSDRNAYEQSEPRDGKDEKTTERKRPIAMLPFSEKWHTDPDLDNGSINEYLYAIQCRREQLSSVPTKPSVANKNVGGAGSSNSSSSSNSVKIDVNGGIVSVGGGSKGCTSKSAADLPGTMDTISYFLPPNIMKSRLEQSTPSEGRERQQRAIEADTIRYLLYHHPRALDLKLFLAAWRLEPDVFHTAFECTALRTIFSKAGAPYRLNSQSELNLQSGRAFSYRDCRLNDAAFFSRYTRQGGFAKTNALKYLRGLLYNSHEEEPSYTISSEHVHALIAAVDPNLDYFPAFSEPTSRARKSVTKRTDVETLCILLDYGAKHNLVPKMTVAIVATRGCEWQLTVSLSKTLSLLAEYAARFPDFFRRYNDSFTIELSPKTKEKNKMQSFTKKKGRYGGSSDDGNDNDRNDDDDDRNDDGNDADDGKDDDEDALEVVISRIKNRSDTEDADDIDEDTTSKKKKESVDGDHCHDDVDSP
jgi:hypothetical protein